jgi:phosphatidylglycerophosphate synthase
MKSKLKSWPDFHHRINLVYHAVIAVSLVPFALVFLDIDSGDDATSQLDPSYEWIIILILLAAVFTTCFRVWRKAKERINSIDSNLGIKQKLIAYFNFQIQRYFQLEIAALVSLVGLWLSANYIFVVAYILVLVQFSLLRPSQDKVIRDLRFNKEERERLKGEKL